MSIKENTHGWVQEDSESNFTLEDDSRCLNMFDKLQPTLHNASDYGILGNSAKTSKRSMSVQDQKPHQNDKLKMEDPTADPKAVPAGPKKDSMTMI